MKPGWGQGRAKAVALQEALAAARARGALRSLLAQIAAAWVARIGKAFQIEIGERRLFHWLPVAMGAGVILYFAAADEPVLWYPVALAGGLSLVAFGLRERRIAFIICVGLAALFAGFSFAALRTKLVAAPRIEAPLFTGVSGFIEQIDFRAEGARMLVRVTAIDTLKPDATPYRVRVTTRAKPVAAPGDHVRFRARLLPPPEPARPGAYDFGREAFFRSVGAVGSIPGAISPSAPPGGIGPPVDLRFFAAIDRKRNELTERIVRAYGGQPGAVAAALVTGKRDFISEASNDALRAAGVYHIVSVSGLHMVLAAGAFFWAVRALLALSMELALRLPVKKIAAVIAMLGATAYCLFTGSEVATERSLIMIIVMLGAVLADRPALSMRNLAISALIVMAREPETVMGPSFQMSFAAVAALIAGAEWFQQRQEAAKEAAKAGPSDWFSQLTGKVWLWVAGLLLTTLLATLATAPFAAYHFQRLNPLGLIGNAAALPFVSFIVMPAAVAGVLLWPLGLDGPIWWLMGAGTMPVIGISKAIETMNGSVRAVYAFGPLAILIMAFALCWATLWITWLRWLCLAPALAGLALAARATPPDMFIDRSGQGAAILDNSGALTILGQPSSFTASFWLQAAADLRRASDSALRANSRCDILGCTAQDRQGRIIAWVKDARAFPEDCFRAQFIITPLQTPDWCNAPFIADRKILSDYGAITVRWAGDEPQIAGSRDPALRRPWQPAIKPVRALAADPNRSANPPSPRTDDDASQEPQDMALPVDAPPAR